MAATEPGSTGSNNAGSNNTVLFRTAAPALVLAALVSNQLHELAHGFAGVALGLRPTVLPFAVTYGIDGTAREQVITAAAGPIFSLVLGLIVLATSAAVNRAAGTFFRLFWLWLGHGGVMNFVGHLVIAPFADAGDTGKALRLLGASNIVTIGCCLVGVAGQFALAWSFASRLRPFAGDVTAERAVAVRAWLAGTTVVILLTLAQVLLAPIDPAAAVLVLVYGVAIAIFAPMQFIFRTRVRAAYEGSIPAETSRVGLAVAAAAAVLLFILAALGGLPLAG